VHSHTMIRSNAGVYRPPGGPTSNRKAQKIVLRTVSSNGRYVCRSAVQSACLGQNLDLNSLHICIALAICTAKYTGSMSTHCDMHAVEAS